MKSKEYMSTKEIINIATYQRLNIINSTKSRNNILEKIIY